MIGNNPYKTLSERSGHDYVWTDLDTDTRNQIKAWLGTKNSYRAIKQHMCCKIALAQG